MSRVEELEERIRGLSQEELRELSTWFTRYDAEIWDRQFEADALNGKLDRLADLALKDFSEKRTTDL